VALTVKKGGKALMRGMILAAGEGTRLRPLTFARPKALVPVLTVPIMANIVRWLKTFGVTELAANLWYRGADIERFFGDGSAFGVLLTYLHEDEPHGTAGAVKLMADFLRARGETFLVVGCDELIDLDLAAMVRFHKERHALVTISLAWVDDPRQFGVVHLDENGRIVRFVEKPKEWAGGKALVNSGVYLLEPEVLDRIPSGFYDFGRQLFPTLVAEGAPIFGFASDGYWNDIGHLGNYRDANLAALQKRAPIYDCPLREIRPQVFVHPTAQIAESAQLIAPCAVGAETVIDEGVVIGSETVIGDGCRIGRNAVVERSILWSQVTVADGTHLSDCIITDNCFVQSEQPIRHAVLVACR
jgi:NDP-sugar pyrophosphorylase family protein